MSTPYTLKKSYINHFGLDLKSTDLIRPDGFSSGMKNAQYSKTGEIQKRKGYHCYASNIDNENQEVGGFGLFSFNKKYSVDVGNIFAGQRNNQIISVGKFLHKLETSKFLDETGDVTDKSSLHA